MIISWNWLKEYVPLDMPVAKTWPGSMPYWVRSLSAKAARNPSRTGGSLPRARTPCSVGPNTAAIGP